MTMHTFNGIEYGFAADAAGRVSLYKGSEFMGTFAAHHGAVAAAVADAMPQEYQRSLRERP